MNNQLKIEFAWFRNDAGSDLAKAFYGDIGVAIGDDYLTRLDEPFAKTVRNTVRGSAYQLATWFAANWWRLRWEPEISGWEKNADWRIAHSIASVGGGFVWPNVLFASDGDSLAIASRPSERPSAIEPVCYLSRLDARISAAEFEHKVDAFLEAMLSRLRSFPIRDETLSGVWNEVLAERRDPDMSRQRKLEAICGYDPDEAPEKLLEMLIENGTTLGVAAIEEVAAAGRDSTAEVLNSILTLSKSSASPVEGGFRGVLPTLDDIPPAEDRARPWQVGSHLARFARTQWGLEGEPVNDSFLTDLLRTTPEVFSDHKKTPLFMPMALQTNSEGTFDVYFNSSWNTSKRFSVVRLIGDHLLNSDRLLPATKAKTSRQQFQRAFAQEFLCPIDALVARIQTDQPDEEDIADAAEYFGVSPLMVRTTLVNKGELDREALNAAA